MRARYILKPTKPMQERPAANTMPPMKLGPSKCRSLPPEGDGVGVGGIAVGAGATVDDGDGAGVTVVLVVVEGVVGLLVEGITVVVDGVVVGCGVEVGGESGGGLIVGSGGTIGDILSSTVSFSKELSVVTGRSCLCSPFISNPGPE